MRVQPSNSKNPAVVALPWLWFSDWWTPMIASCAAANNNAQQACVDFSVGWQAFAGRGINQDFHLFQELCAAKSPNDVLHAWSRFWRQAVTDYGEDYCAMAKLTARFAPDRISPGAEADEQPRPPLSKAA